MTPHLSSEFARLQDELAGLQTEILNQSKVITSLTSLIASQASSTASAPPPPHFAPSTLKQADEWRRWLLVTNNNANNESNKNRPRFEKTTDLTGVLVDRCGLSVRSIRNFEKIGHAKFRIELDSERSVLQALQAIERMRDEEGKLPFSTKIVRDWPRESKELRQKRMCEAIRMGNTYFVDEVDLQIRNTLEHHGSIPPVAENSSNPCNVALMLTKTMNTKSLDDALENLCQIGNLRREEILRQFPSSTLIRLDLDSEKTLLRVLGKLNEVRKTGKQLPFVVFRYLPMHLRYKRAQAIEKLKQSCGMYLDEIDLQLKPCQNAAETEVNSDNFPKNCLIFSFNNSNSVNKENASMKFAQLVEECGASNKSICSTKFLATKLAIIFNDETSSVEVLRSFHEKKLNGSLSEEFRNSKLCFQLPPQLVQKRNDLYCEVNNKKMSFGITNLYVDEVDLTIKEKPVPEGQFSSANVADSLPSTNESEVLQFSDTDSEESYHKRFFAIRYGDKYAKHTANQLFEELFQSDASEIEIEGREPNGWKVSVKPTSHKSLEEILDKKFPDDIEIKW